MFRLALFAFLCALVLGQTTLELTGQPYYTIDQYITVNFTTTVATNTNWFALYPEANNCNDTHCGSGYLRSAIPQNGVLSGSVRFSMPSAGAYVVYYLTSNSGAQNAYETKTEVIYVTHPPSWPNATLAINNFSFIQLYNSSTTVFFTSDVKSSSTYNWIGVYQNTSLCNATHCFNDYSGSRTTISSNLVNGTVTISLPTTTGKYRAYYMTRNSGSPYTWAARTEEFDVVAPLFPTTTVFPQSYEPIFRHNQTKFVVNFTTDWKTQLSFTRIVLYRQLSSCNDTHCGSDYTDYEIPSDGLYSGSVNFNVPIPGTYVLYYLISIAGAPYRWVAVSNPITVVDPPLPIAKLTINGYTGPFELGSSISINVSFTTDVTTSSKFNWIGIYRDIPSLCNQTHCNTNYYSYRDLSDGLLSGYLLFTIPNDAENYYAYYMTSNNSPYRYAAKTQLIVVIYPRINLTITNYNFGTSFYDNATSIVVDFSTNALTSNTNWFAIFPSNSSCNNKTCGNDYMSYAQPTEGVKNGTLQVEVPYIAGDYYLYYFVNFDVPPYRWSTQSELFTVINTDYTNYTVDVILPACGADFPTVVPTPEPSTCGSLDRTLVAESTLSSNVARVIVLYNFDSPKITFFTQDGNKSRSSANIFGAEQAPLFSMDNMFVENTDEKITVINMRIDYISTGGRLIPSFSLLLLSIITCASIFSGPFFLSKQWKSLFLIMVFVMMGTLGRADAACLEVRANVAVPSSVNQVCHGTSMNSLNCFNQTNLPHATASYYANPRDMTLYKETNDNGGESVFYSTKDVNGIPAFIYTMTTILPQDSTIPVTVANATNLLRALAKTQFKLVNNSYVVVKRAVVDFVDFQFKYIADKENLTRDTAFYAQVSSAGGLFNFNTPKRYFHNLIDFTSIGKLPNLPDRKYLHTYNYTRELDIIENEHLNTVFQFGLVGNDQYPLLDSTTDFFISTKDENGATLKTDIVSALQTSNGIFAAKLPLFPAPVDDPNWINLFQSMADKHVATQCAVVHAMREATMCLCNDINIQIQDLINSNNFLSAFGANISFAYDEGNRTVAACHTLFSEAWAQSCGNINTLKRQQSGPKHGSIVDSFTTNQQSVDPVSLILGTGTASVEKGNTFNVPAGNNRNYGSADPSTSSSSLTTSSHVQPRCNAVSEAGNNLPSTRVVNLGQSMGSFQFSYETYSVKDRIVVLHGSTQLHDSRCVGTNGYRTVKLKLNPSQRSDFVSVRVEPNCDGTSGTEWKWSAGCTTPEKLKCPIMLFTGPCVCKDEDDNSYPSTQIRNPKSNGCGAEGSSMNPYISKYIGDLWESAFTPVCDAHDICYGTCHVIRGTCDTAMCNGHRNVCDQLRSQLDAAGKDPTHCFSMRDSINLKTGLLEPKVPCNYYAKCRRDASVVCNAVYYGGRGAFQSAQEEACSCD